jgi:hypothetical protein
MKKGNPSNMMSKMGGKKGMTSMPTKKGKSKKGC